MLIFHRTACFQLSTCRHTIPGKFLILPSNPYNPFCKFISGVLEIPVIHMESNRYQFIRFTLLPVSRIDYPPLYCYRDPTSWQKCITWYSNKKPPLYKPLVSQPVSGRFQLYKTMVFCPFNTKPRVSQHEKRRGLLQYQLIRMVGLESVLRCSSTLTTFGSVETVLYCFLVIDTSLRWHSFNVGRCLNHHMVRFLSMHIWGFFGSR